MTAESTQLGGGSVHIGGVGVVFVLKSRVGSGIFKNRSVPVDSRLCRCCSALFMYVGLRFG